MGSLSQMALNEIKIPFPPLSIQQAIATHIHGLREAAKQLEEEAKTIMEAAKVEVEK